MEPDYTLSGDKNAQLAKSPTIAGSDSQRLLDVPELP